MKKFLILAFVLFFIFPAVSFAQPEIGKVVGYWQTWRGTPPTASLDKLTHIILFHIFPGADNRSLDLEHMRMSGDVLRNFVNLAHSKDVKVIIALGGEASWELKSRFTPATNSTNRPHFVQAIKRYVEEYNLDGVDLDWETSVDWQQFLDLSLDMKAAMPDKRISVTIGADSPTCHIGNHFTTNPVILANFQRDVWKIDAVQIMTYDMGGLGFHPILGPMWPTPAAASGSITTINNWATFGQGQQGFDKAKILIGAQIYQDNESSTREKVRYARQNEFGGIIIWDATSENVNTFLHWAWDENFKHGGHRPGGNQTQTFTVTFNSNGGSTVNNITGVESGTTINKPADPTRNNHTFDGWFDGNTLFVFTTPITQNITLTARWTRTEGCEVKGESADLAKGYWDWVRDMDNENLGSSVTHNVAEGNITFSLNQGPPEGTRYTWAQIASYPGGDWTTVSSITITYTSNEPINIVLQDNIGLTNDGRGYFVTLQADTNRTQTIQMTEFRHIANWSTPDNLVALTLNQLGIFSGVAIVPTNTNVMTTGAITSLVINGLAYEIEIDCPISIMPNRSTPRTITGINAVIMNGNLNLSLPANVRTADITLFDVRGRLVFERNVAINGNFASVALPNSIAANQMLVLQIRTNSGINLTKRILVK